MKAQLFFPSEDVFRHLGSKKPKSKTTKTRNIKMREDNGAKDKEGIPVQSRILKIRELDRLFRVPSGSHY